MDLCQKVQYLTLDIITSLAFGYHFGYIEQDADVHQYIKMTEQSMPAMMTLSVFPHLAKLLQSPLFRQAMPSEHDRVGFGKFIAWVALLFLSCKQLTLLVLPKRSWRRG